MIVDMNLFLLFYSLVLEHAAGSAAHTR